MFKTLYTILKRYATDFFDSKKISVLLAVYEISVSKDTARSLIKINIFVNNFKI